MDSRVFLTLTRQFKFRIQSNFCSIFNLIRVHKQLPHVFFRIEGWFDFDDIYLEQAKRATTDMVFVEIGSYFGKSLSFLIIECYNRNQLPKIVAVDTWQGSDEHLSIVEQHGGTLYKTFRRNMELAKIDQFVTPIQMSSVVASQQFQDESIDFVFIDAAHDYENVKADLNAWYPKLKRNGVIAGHDYTETWSGVIQAVNEFFDTNFEVRGVCWIHYKIK